MDQHCWEGNAEFFPNLRFDSDTCSTLPDLIEHWPQKIRTAVQAPEVSCSITDWLSSVQFSKTPGNDFFLPSKAGSSWKRSFSRALGIAFSYAHCKAGLTTSSPRSPTWGLLCPLPPHLPQHPLSLLSLPLGCTLDERFLVSWRKIVAGQETCPHGQRAALELE